MMTLTEQRAAIGLRTPNYQQKKTIWSRVAVPSAGISQGYKPLISARYAHQANARGVAVSGGWRAGKSLASGMEGVSWLPYANLVWLVAKDYDMTRQEFIYMSEAGLSTGLVLPGSIKMSLNKYQPSALQSITGCVVETRTLADPMKLAAKPPDLVIVCEPGLIDNLSLVMELLWGRVSERRGCIWLAGTSDESSEEWYELWESWNRENPADGRAFSIPTWQNRYRFPDGRHEREFALYEEMYGNEALMAHYGGVPASPRDLVLRGYWNPALHVVDDMTFDPRYPAEISIDPNYSMGHNYAVELIQWNVATGEIWLADEVAVEGMTHDQVRQLCEQKEWWPYVSGGTIDPYAGESHVYGAPAPITYWPPFLRAPIRSRVNTTVQALKESLAIGETGRPRLQVSSNCSRFIHEAARWRQSKQGKPNESNCDALKALGYWLVDFFGHERLGQRRGEDNVAIAGDWMIE